MSISLTAWDQNQESERLKKKIIHELADESSRHKLKGKRRTTQTPLQTPGAIV